MFFFTGIMEHGNDGIMGNANLRFNLPLFQHSNISVETVYKDQVN
jgi:hypothetical protein